jgi:hypothetical protein
VRDALGDDTYKRIFPGRKHVNHARSQESVPSSVPSRQTGGPSTASFVASTPNQSVRSDDSEAAQSTVADPGQTSGEATSPATTQETVIAHSDVPTTHGATGQLNIDVRYEDGWLFDRSGARYLKMWILPVDTNSIRFGGLYPNILNQRVLVQEGLCLVSYNAKIKNESWMTSARKAGQYVCGLTGHEALRARWFSITVSTGYTAFERLTRFVGVSWTGTGDCLDTAETIEQDARLLTSSFEMSLRSDKQREIRKERKADILARRSELRRKGRRIMEGLVTDLQDLENRSLDINVLYSDEQVDEFLRHVESSFRMATTYWRRYDSAVEPTAQ